MSWEDRDYASDEDPMRRFGRPGGDWQGLRPALDNPMTWSLPLARILAITVRVHVIFLIFIVIEMLRPVFGSSGLGIGPTVLLLGCLFGVVLVHEFGHCLACRWSGGAADEILMWPLGGLAYCRPPQRWTAHLVTAAGGPMVNVILLTMLVPVIGVLTGQWWGVAIPNPISLSLPAAVAAPWPLMTLYLLNAVSLVLLLFNLLPIFPLDGGRVLQALLWPKIGYVRSMRYAVRTGYVGAIGLAIMGFVIGNMMLLCIAIFGGITCYITHRQLQFTQDTLGFESDDYSASLYGPDEDKAVPAGPSPRRARAAERRARREERESLAVDDILQKIATSGMESLSRVEKRRLRARRAEVRIETATDMGIYDRDYIRRRPPASPAGRMGLSAVRGWSVNTWIIAICVVVFAIDGLIPPVKGWWQPVLIRVSRDVPGYVVFAGGDQYRERGNPMLEDASLQRRTMLFERDLIDVSVSPAVKVGTVTYQWMPPLKRWFHFSTDLAFRGLQVWRFIGFQFLHGSLMHLLFNMIALYFFGSIVERYLGGKRYLAFYLLCGICGALMYLVLNLGAMMVSLLAGRAVAIPGLLFDSMATPLVGASAGVFGVLMAGAFVAPNAVVLLFFVLPMRLATLAYALVALALVSVLFGVENAGGEAGHLGGAIAGFYLIRHPGSLHGFFDFVGWADPTSHHYRGRSAGKRRAAVPRHEIDRILDKISADGLHSLTDQEKKVLREASEKGA